MPKQQTIQTNGLLLLQPMLGHNTALEQRIVVYKEKDSIVPKGLSVRVHQCPYCGLVTGRDVNLAQNILRKALHNSLERSGQAVTRTIAPSVD